MAGRGDFLDEIIRERSARNPDFARGVEAALRRRELVRKMARSRERSGVTQTQVAQRMTTSQPAVAKIESGEVDPRASTLERYAAALGGELRYVFVPRRTRPQRRVAARA